MPGILFFYREDDIINAERKQASAKQIGKKGKKI